MNFINGITILLVYQLIGEVTVISLGISIPGPVLGMFMLFVTLMIRKGVPEAVEAGANALLSHLSLLFVPAGVGLMVHFSRISDEWIPIGVALIVSTVVTMISTAFIMIGLSRITNKRITNDR
ncbi:MAG: CidA/LrgA family protein [Gammaproteobacteria bacterium]|nr:CidA/LrgA family protein [Gammaproteobacteria bacterium]